jgi:uncharacterized membrane protein
MKGFFKFVRVTLTGGILFLVPVIVILAVIDKALVMANKIVSPLAKHSPIGFATPKLLAGVLLIVICFLAGIFARAAVAKKFTGWLETTLLSMLPGYEFLKGIGENVLGAESALSHNVVLAWIEDSWQLGFLVERLEGGHLAVFIPGAPNPHSGSVYFFDGGQGQANRDSGAVRFEDSQAPWGWSEHFARKPTGRAGIGLSAGTKSPSRSFHRKPRHDSEKMK